MSKILQMTHADYLSHPAYGASDIIKMGTSLAYFQEKKKNPDPKGRPLVVGSAFHLRLEACITKNVSLDAGTLIYKGGSSLTKGFKEFQAANPHQYCIDEDEDALCDRMLSAVLAESEAMSYLEGAIPEATVMGKYPGTDINVKCRPDYLHMGRGVSINVKTAADASESGFIYGARDYGYDWQSSMYCTVLSQELKQPFDEIHILVEKGETASECIVNIFSFGDDTLAFARQQIWEVMQKIPECEKTGIWPKNKAYLRTIDLPLHIRKVVSL